MASVGLTIQDNPQVGSSLSLADTLAKGIFGDPEGQMKARALASQVLAHQAYATKLGADTGLVNVKTREEQAAADALDAAAAHPDALVAAVPTPAQPVPVTDQTVLRANAPGTTGYGPQPAIVTPDAQRAYDDSVRMHDAQVATLKSLWPVIVRSGNSTQIIEALGKGEGLAGLSSGLVPGAKVDPNVQRVAGGLYTGSAPTTSTVWSPGDTAGVDAEARAKIAEETAKSKLPAGPHDVTYRGQPGQTSTDSSGKLIYTPAQGTEQTPEKPNIITIKDKPYVVTTTQDGRTVGTPVDGISPPVELKESGGGYVTINTDTGVATPVQGAEPRPKIVNVGKNETPMVEDPTGSLTVAPGFTPPTPEPTPPYQGKTAKDDALNRIVALQQKLANKQPITQQEAALYESDYNLAYGTTNQKIVDPQTGKTINTKIDASIPANTPTVNDVRVAAGQAPLPAPPPEPKQGAKSPTVEQTQLQLYADPLVNSTTKLDKLTPAQIPGVFIQKILGVGGDDPTFVQQLLASTGAVSPQQRQFGQAVAEYNQSLLYMLSGKAITSDEYKRAMRSYIPLPGDGPEQLAWKAEQRHTIIASAVRLGFSNDPEMARTFAANVKRKTGIDLAPLDLTGTLGEVQAPTSDDKPPASYPGSPESWKHVSPEERKLFQ